MARKAKYDWGRSRDGRYQKFETRIATKLVATASGEPYADSGYIDIAQCLSLINRKLVRQGQVFKVKNMALYSKDESPVTTWKVGALPRTWPMFNAYKKARSLWLEQINEAYKHVGASNLPKYLDFKVYADEGHVDNALAGSDIMLPMDFDENMVTQTDTDWDYSKMHSSASTSDEFLLHVCGRHRDASGNWISSETDTSTLTSAGLIFGYQQSRGVTLENLDDSGLTQRSANVLEAGPFGRISLAGDDQLSDIIDDMAEDNDSPPYDYNEYPGGPSELKEMTTIATGRVAQKTQGSQGNRVPTFEAPLGLVRVEIDAGSAMSSEEVEVHFDTEIIGTI